MAASRRQAIEQLQPQFARLPKGPIVDALLASDLTPTMDLHKFRSNFKGQGKKGFVSEGETQNWDIS